MSLIVSQMLGVCSGRIFKKEKMKGMNKFGIGFWAGACVYSVINMIMNYNHIVQSKILNYDYIITGAAVFGLILNIVLLNKKKK